MVLSASYGRFGGKFTIDMTTDTPRFGASHTCHAARARRRAARKRAQPRAASDGTATCAPTTEEADLSLSIADLATLWLGDESAVRLAALGRVRERQEGAARLADALLRTSRRPWCPDIF